MCALSDIGTLSAQEELMRIMKSGYGPYCKIARDLLNEKKKEEDRYALCPNCYMFLGITGDLWKKGFQITNQMREEAYKKRIDIIGGSAYYLCPKCGVQILV